jgi:hypothetical protein
MAFHFDYRNLLIALLGLFVFAGEGCRQLYRSRHVDRLERAGKMLPDSAARVRKRPWWGWALVGGGIAFFLVRLLSI